MGEDYTRRDSMFYVWEKKGLKGILGFVVFVCIFLLSGIGVGIGYWDTTIIDSSAAMYNELAVDSNDKLHGTYRDLNYDVMYATNASGTLKFETVAELGQGNEYHSDTSIAVDSNNNVHIAYMDWVWDLVSNSYKGYVKHAKKNAYGGWDRLTIDDMDYQKRGGEPWYWELDIAVDSNNKVHISYNVFDKKNSKNFLRHATNASGTWTIETVENGDVGWDSSIAIDSNNKVHIAYVYVYGTDDIYKGLKYATNKSGSWVITTVGESNADVGWASDIAIDSRNSVHIVYHNYNNTDPSLTFLKYATNKSGSWVIKTVDAQSHPCAIAKLVIDFSGNMHVVYRASDKIIKHAKNSVGNYSKIWTITTVYDADAPDGTGVVVCCSSMDIDSNNITHILFDDVSSNPNVTNNLRYTNNDSCSISGPPENSPIKIGSAYYSTLQNAYDSAWDGDVIQAQYIQLIGNLYADDIINKTVTIDGGYDCDFTAVSGQTKLKGQITISNGKVTTGNFRLKQ